MATTYFLLNQDIDLSIKQTKNNTRIGAQIQSELLLLTNSE